MESTLSALRPDHSHQHSPFTLEDSRPTDDYWRGCRQVFARVASHLLDSILVLLISFSGDGAFAHYQLTCLDCESISRHLETALEQHQVSHHNIFAVYLYSAALTNDIVVIGVLFDYAQLFKLLLAT